MIDESGTPGDGEHSRVRCRDDRLLLRESLGSSWGIDSMTEQIHVLMVRFEDGIHLGPGYENPERAGQAVREIEHSGMVEEVTFETVNLVRSSPY